MRSCAISRAARGGWRWRSASIWVSMAPTFARGAGYGWARRGNARPPVAVTTRIGIARETHRLLRFYVPGSPFVSGPRKLLSGEVEPPGEA